MTPNEKELVRCIRMIEENWDGGDLALAFKIAAEFADIVEAKEGK